MKLNQFFAFNGRLERRGFVFFYGVPFLLIGALPGLLLPHGPTQVALESLVLLLILPGVARRLHDVGQAFRVFLIAYAVYPVVLALQTTGVFGEWRELVVLLSGVPFLATILVLFFVRGSSEPNRFGAVPERTRRAA